MQHSLLMRVKTILKSYSGGGLVGDPEDRVAAELADDPAVVFFHTPFTASRAGR